MNIFDVIFPKFCFGCGRSGTYICKNCINKLPKPVQTCPFCQKASIDGVTHTKCKKKWGIDGIYSIFPYEGVIKKAILKLKFKYANDIVSELVEYSVSILNEDNILPKKATLTPIPLYWYKENIRGFNQSKLVGEEISEKIGWKFDNNVLVRRKLKKPQSVLEKGERIKNIRGVFVLNSSHKLLPISYILFDDVYTTGSTLREAAKVLKRNGVKKVWGLTIAK